MSAYCIGNKRRVMAAVITVLILVAGCGGTKPEDVSVPTDTPPPSTPVPSPTANEADTLRILFIGNSHTFTNDLPGTFAELARAGGHAVSVDSSAKGGYTLEQHIADGDTQDKLNSGPWDFVILQESTFVFEQESERNARMVPAVRALDENIKKAGGQTILMMMWATSKAINQNELEHFAEAQAQAAASTLEIAGEVKGLVAPVGIAWENALRQRPELELWRYDRVHATDEGTYLMACVLYATIYRQSPVGLSATAGLPEETALFLQGIATEAGPFE